MCFLGTSKFSIMNVPGDGLVNSAPEVSVEIQNLDYTNALVGQHGQLHEILNIYKLKEYKVIKMVCIAEGSLGQDIPTIKTYLKPSHYLLYDNQTIKASELVDRGLAQYEKYHVLNFYLLNVKSSNSAAENEMDIASSSCSPSIHRINSFVKMNGILVSVYNSHHPLNNRFHHYTIKRDILSLN